MFLLPLCKGITRKINALITSDKTFSRRFQEEIEHVEVKVAGVEGAVRAAEVEVERGGKEEKRLRKLQDVLYDVDDLLDDLSTEDLQVSHRNPLTSTFKSRLEDVNKRLAKLTPLEMGRNVIEGVEDADMKPLMSWSTIVARDPEKRTIIKFLTETRSKTAVVSVWGEVGIGKTTLAKLVWNDEKVRSHFNPLMWANVHNKFNLKTVIQDLLELNHEHRGLFGMDDLQKLLQQELEGKKSLVVLDDVGNFTLKHCNVLIDLLTKLGVAGILILAVDVGVADLVEKTLKGKEDEVSRKQVPLHSEGIPIEERIPIEEQISIKEGSDQIRNFLLNDSDDGKGKEDEFSRKQIPSRSEGIATEEGTDKKKEMPTLSVMAITGPSNTLLEDIFRDKKVEEQFSYSKRVSVSCEKFNLKKIAESILGADSNKTLQRLQIELDAKLQGKRFLIVLEGVLDMNPYQLYKLRVFLMNDMGGNKLLITTNDKKVAGIADSKIHLAPSSSDRVPMTQGVQPTVHDKLQLQPLSSNDSWNLVVKAVPAEDDKARQLLTAEIRKKKEILEGCGGRPLALRMLGGMVSFETDEHKLINIQKKTRPFDIMNILKLSFHTLPSSIKTCFLYSMCFPVYPPNRESLTQQWIAQGLIVPPAEKKLEDVANEYFDVLLSRSFFYNLVDDDFEVETRFEVHDLVRWLAHLVSNGEFCITSSDQIKNIPSSVRHVALSSNKSKDIPWLLRRLKKWRTIKWENFGSLSTSTLNKNLLSKSLRVLDFSNSVFKELPSSIGELYHLRYLDFSHNIYLESLPSSLFSLYNLETLRMDGCAIRELPKDIQKLKKLRNLYACTKEVSVDHGGTSVDHDGTSVDRGWIGDLTLLRIFHLNPIHNLETLPKGLEKLTALETLVLKSCSKLKISENDLEGLTSLRSLTITHLAQNSILPKGLQKAASLSSMCLFYCVGLKFLPKWLQELQSLKKLRVEFCPNLTVSPEDLCLPHGLQYLSIRGCQGLSSRCEGEDWQKIAHIPEIHLNGRRIKTSSGERTEFDITARLKYDNIKEKETKFCFLLCCLCPEGIDIRIEYIIRYAMGIGLFGDTTTMSEVRARVNMAIEELTGSSLLEKSLSNNLTMDGRLRKFAMSVASEDEHMFFFDEAWRKRLEYNFMKQIRCISLNGNQFPEKLECPRLELLSWLGNKGFGGIPNSCFQGMMMLRVLDLSEYSSSESITFRLPPSLKCLESLRSLLLDFCNLEGDLSIIGYLSKLEILSLRGSNIRELPVEIGGLNKLRLLDLDDCAELKSIPANVISRLFLLEELYMQRGFRNWEVVKRGSDVAQDNARKRNASLSEIQSLSSLTVFSAKVNHVNCLPDDLSFSGNLTKFDLFIGKISSSIILPKQDVDIRQGPWVNNFFVEGDYSYHIELASSLLPKVGHLILKRVKMTPILSDLDEEGAFNALKSLRLDTCYNLEYLSGSTNVAFANLEELWLESLVSMKEFEERVPIPGSFQNLRILNIRECHNGIVPSNRIRKLPKLEWLHVRRCSGLREIIDAAEIANEPEMTPPLASIKILRLESLKDLLTICQRPQKIISFSNLIELHINNCPRLAFIFSPYMSQTLFNLQTVTIERCNKLRAIFEEAEEGAVMDEIQPLEFSELKKIIVDGCGQLRSMFPVFIARGLVKLQELYISDCRNLTSIFEETEKGAVMDEIQPLEFPELKTVNVNKCEELRRLFPFFIDRGLVKLQELYISDCRNLTSIFEETEKGAVMDEIQPLEFPELKTVNVNKCEELRRLFPFFIDRGLVKLQELYISDCRNLTSIFEETEKGAVMDEIQPLEFPELKTVNVNKCEELRRLFPFFIDRGLVKLQELYISDCRNLTSIFEETEKGAVMDEIQPLEFPELKTVNVNKCEKLRRLFPFFNDRGLVKLEELYISNCRNLTSIFEETEKGAVMDETQPLEFSKLRTVNVNKCEELRWLFPFFIDQGLVKLQVLDISDCKNLTSIFEETEKGAVMDEIQPLEFPELTSVNVKKCEELRRLFPFFNDRGLVKLEELYISNCRNLTSIFEETEKGAVMDETQPLEFSKLRTVNVNKCEELRWLFPFFIDRGLVKLQKLYISDCRNLTSIFEDMEREALMYKFQPLKFPELMTVYVEKCKELRRMFPFFIDRGLVKLQELYISDCRNLTSIFEETEKGAVMDEIQPLEFPELKTVNVNKCEELRRLFPFFIDRGLVKLQKLYISDCRNLTSIFEDMEREALMYKFQPLKFPELMTVYVEKCKELRRMFPFFIDRGLVKLQELYISDCRNLTSIFEETEKGALMYKFQPLKFPELKMVKVKKCEELRSLFSVFIARGLVELRVLSISECENMVELISCGDSIAYSKEIRLRWLRKMEINDLSKLKRFCPVGYSLCLPLLEELELTKCPELVKLTSDTAAAYGLMNIPASANLL